jgi:hypothetical protein
MTNMKLAYIQLFEFLYDLIDIQIKKYSALTRIGVGPDAGMNAALVADEVDELISFAETLLISIEQKKYDKTELTTIFNQIRFYIEQEYLRATAGWFLDENNIHSSSVQRLNQQKQLLTNIATEASININQAAPAMTERQKQCEHDSHEIAFFILDIVADLRKNPNLVFNANIPTHAQRILRIHSAPNGRFQQEPLWQKIQPLHNQCWLFLRNSSLRRSTDILTEQGAQDLAGEHQRTLTAILADYLKAEPKSPLAHPEHPPYRIGVSPPARIRPSYQGLFGSALAVGAISAFIYFLSQWQQNSGLSSGISRNP